MLGYILFGSLFSVFIAYVLLSERWLRHEDLWLRLIYAIFWPITALVWLVRRPVLRPMWFFIGRGFAFLGRGLSFLLLHTLEPILIIIVALWFQWLNRWPEPERLRIHLATIIAVTWTPAALVNWFRHHEVAITIFLGIGVVAAFVVILVIFHRLRKAKQANSS